MRYLTCIALLIVSFNVKAQINSDLYDYLDDSVKSAFKQRGFVILGPRGQRLIEVDTTYVRRLAVSTRKTWLVLWGTHCQPCMDDILLSRKIYKTELSDTSIQFLLVATAYDTELIKRYMTLGYPDDIYVLKQEAFGSHVFKKTDRFRQAIYPHESTESKKKDGYCQHYILDERGEVTHFFAGSDERFYPLIKASLK